MQNMRINTDLVAGGLGLAIFAFFWLNRGQQSPLSSMFPDAVLVVLLLVSLALVVKGVWNPEIRRGVEDRNMGRVALMVAALGLWWLGIRHVGFLVTSGPMFLAISLYLASRAGPLSWRLGGMAVLATVLVVGGFYLVFAEVLQIRPFRTPLP